MNSDEYNDWTDVWNKPLRYDGQCYVWADNNTMALTFFGLSEEERLKCVDAINGLSQYKLQGLVKLGVDFYVGDIYVFCVRGWGEMTGNNGFNMSNEKAKQLQDTFVTHIYDTLN